jgi:hypothetical protein
MLHTYKATSALIFASKFEEKKFSATNGHPKYYRTLQNFTVTVRLIELFGGSLCGTVLPYLAKFHSHSSLDRAVWWELVRDCITVPCKISQSQFA